MNHSTDFGFNDTVGRINFGTGSRHLGKVPDVKRPEPPNTDPLDVPKKPEAPKPNMRIIYMDKLKKFLAETFKGEGVVGQIVATLLELTGAGSLHALIRGTIKRAQDRDDAVGSIVQTLLKIRWVQLLATLFVVITLWMGHIPYEVAWEAVKFIWQFLPALL